MTDILRRLHCTIRCDIETAESECHCAEGRDTITALRAEVERLGKDYQTARDAHDKLLGEVERFKLSLTDTVKQTQEQAEEIVRLREALEEIASITVHSGGDIHGISPTAWRAAFGHAHAVARAALEEKP